MRILYRYILKEHISPFLFAFFTITFLFIIDYVPDIVDNVIDKDLSWWIVIELVVLNLAWMLALSVPMSVLVATLMAFGRLSSDSEMTAIKAAGVNLLHILLPLLAAASIIMFGMVQFNDKVLPDANKKARQLKGNISAMRPTLTFQAGMFITAIPGYLVLIDEIDHVTSRVEGVRITDTKVANEPQIIIAEYGYLKITDNGKTLQFTLYDGEVHTTNVIEPENYRRMGFEKHVINVTDPRAELTRTESSYRGDREKDLEEMRRNVSHSLAAIEPLNERLRVSLQNSLDSLMGDDIPWSSENPVSDSVALMILKNRVLTLKRKIDAAIQNIQPHKSNERGILIEIYKKYSIPAASLAFILIGAPLGIMSRKEGMGMAISISILLFIVYWAFLIGGEDIADRGLLSPFWAMWAANILLGVIGAYLIYIVLSEKPIFSWFRRSK